MIGTPYPLAGKAIRPAYEAKARRAMRYSKSFFFCRSPPSPGASGNCGIEYEIPLFRVQIRGVSIRYETKCVSRLRHNANLNGWFALHASQLRKAISEGLAMPNRYRNGDGYAAMHRRFMLYPKPFGIDGLAEILIRGIDNASLIVALRAMLANAFLTIESVCRFAIAAGNHRAFHHVIHRATTSSIRVEQSFIAAFGKPTRNDFLNRYAHC